MTDLPARLLAFLVGALLLLWHGEYRLRIAYADKLADRAPIHGVIDDTVKRGQSWTLTVNAAPTEAGAKIGVKK